MTHDNPSLQTKFGNRVLALPLASLLSSANQIIASTWGYDQLLPKKLSVVSEKKLYPIEKKPSLASTGRQVTFTITEGNC